MLDDIAAATAVVAATPDRLRSLVAHVPAELLSRRPREGEWSALECIEHMADTESAVFTRRFRAFLEGAAEFPNFEPRTTGQARPQDLVEAFGRAREQNLQLVGTLTEADLSRESRHQRLGPVSLATQIQEWAAHDLNHVIQAERAIMQPFIAASGPWRETFADHDVS